MYNERIKPLFESSGEKDAQLEKSMNLPRGIIYDWNIGRSKSYKKYISEIATYFNVSTDYLLGNETIELGQKEIRSPEDERILRMLSQNKEFRELVEVASRLTANELEILADYAAVRADKLSKEHRE